jgi:cyclohexadieny/prephenate dehydrogenase
MPCSPPSANGLFSGPIMNETLTILEKPIFGTLAVIGTGLIGSSLARAARASKAVSHIIMSDASARVCERVRTLGIADSVYEDAAEAVREADFIILCVPVGACGTVMEAIAPFLRPGAVLSDTGSVKGAVMAQIGPFLPQQVTFVPGHPVAGTEYSGPDAGFSTLFHNRWCILTPDNQPDETVSQVQAFWEACGAKVEIMSASHHDLVLAITSHVPHLIAYNIVGTAADLETVTQSEVVKFSAGGFRDFTRIAASDPVMWRDIFLNNKGAVLEMLGRFNEDLAALARAIRWDDGNALLELFTRTRAIRRGVVEEGQ